MAHLPVCFPVWTIAVLRKERFIGEHPAFDRQTPMIPPKPAAFAHGAMAWDEPADRVAPHRRAHRAHRLWGADAGCDVGICGDLARGDLHQGLPDFDLERGADQMQMRRRFGIKGALDMGRDGGIVMDEIGLGPARNHIRKRGLAPDFMAKPKPTQPLRGGGGDHLAKRALAEPICDAQPRAFLRIGARAHRFPCQKQIVQSPRPRQARFMRGGKCCVMCAQQLFCVAKCQILLKTFRGYPRPTGEHTLEMRGAQTGLRGEILQGHWGVCVIDCVNGAAHDVEMIGGVLGHGGSVAILANSNKCALKHDPFLAHLAPHPVRAVAMYGELGHTTDMVKQLDYHTIRQIFSRFQEAEPEPKGELDHSNAYTLLVAVALSAQATDAGVNKATRDLFPIADTPAKMLALGEEGVIAHIKTIGLFRNKAKNVIKMAQILEEKYDGIVPNSRAALESLPGVGRKTANVVLNMWWHVPTQAVDTHIFRFGNRSGVAVGKDVVAVERAIEDHIPADFQQHAHHWMILHGRYHCKARKPLCGTCIIRDLCQFEDKNL